MAQREKPFIQVQNTSGAVAKFQEIVETTTARELNSPAEAAKPRLGQGINA
jgi:hypothetical protein